MAAKKKLTKEQRAAAQLLTPTFRVSYPHVFKPQQVKPTDKPKYTVTMLLPKTTDMAPLKAAMKAAKINAFGSKENWPDDLESPVQDGDDPKHAKKEGYKNHWVIKASSGEDQKPSVLGPNIDDDTGELEVLKASSEFYAGCYAKAFVYAYVWEYMGKQGVGFILDHVQKVKEGKPFSSKKPASEIFSPVNAGSDDDADEADMDFT